MEILIKSGMSHKCYRNMTSDIAPAKFQSVLSFGCYLVAVLLLSSLLPRCERYVVWRPRICRPCNWKFFFAFSKAIYTCGTT